MLNDDMDLVRAYARCDSEQAFATLVARHVNLVYSVAMRQVGDGPLAREITQAVFIILARKAKTLGDRTVLSGWLCRTARYVSADAVKQQRRRQWREQEAYMQSLVNEPSVDDWWHIAPLLDSALAELGEKDHNAIVLRYLENKNLGEVWRALGASEAAAKMRVGRALEKLRKFFAKRGIALSVTAIAGAVSANSVQAAPAGMAQIISTVARAKGVAAGGSTLALVKGAIKIMAWRKMKTAMAAGAVAILLAAATSLVAQHEIQTKAADFGGGSEAPGIPYKMLADACQITAGVDQTKFVAALQISPFNKKIRPEDIVLTIHSTVKGPLQVSLDKRGHLLNFPDDEALRRENPQVTHDPATGKLNMILVAYLPISELSFPYRRLGDGIAEMNRAIPRANQMIKESYAKQFHPITGEARNVVFFFPRSSAGTATVEIDSVAGQKVYHADARGRIKLTLDPALLAENPTVKVSEKPNTITPDPQELHP